MRDDIQKTKSERAEARDPSTPPARLAALVERWPREVSRNPGLALVLLAQPDFWRQVPDALCLLAESPHCPPSYAAWVVAQAERDDARLASVMTNRALPPSLRRAAFRKYAAPPTDEEGWAEQHAALSDFLSPAELSLLQRAGAAGAADLSLTAAELDALSALGAWGEQLAVAHPNVSSELLARQADAGLLLPLGHPRLPRVQLERALASTAPAALGQVATNPALTPEDCRALLAHAAPALHERLASNPSLPAGVVAWLLEHGHAAVRGVLSQNPSLTPEAQLVIAADAKYGGWLLRNPSVTREAQRLAEQTDLLQQRSALGRRVARATHRDLAQKRRARQGGR